MPQGPFRILSLRDHAVPRQSVIQYIMIGTLHGVPLFGRIDQERFRPSPIGQTVRHCWLNLPIEYPEFGFERFAVSPDRFEALILAPPGHERHTPVRGVIAHFKALVTEAAGLGRTVWSPGFTLIPFAAGSSASPGRGAFPMAHTVSPGARTRVYRFRRPGGREE